MGVRLAAREAPGLDLEVARLGRQTRGVTAEQGLPGDPSERLRVGFPVRPPFDPLPAESSAP